MASDPILRVEEDIDDRILEFCGKNPTLEPEAVLRDIARIVCILNLVRLGELDGKTRVLCGGMAMRCLESPRMSVYDADTASPKPIDVDAMRDSITYDEEDIAITAGATEPGKDLVTFQPVTYDARFSALPGAADQFSISFAYRGLELPCKTAPFNHRYPFALLARETEVPIMHPQEILAEKVAAGCSVTPSTTTTSPS